MPRFVILLAALTVILTVAWAAPNQKVVHPSAGASGEWRLIGTTPADHAADHDGIVVQGPFDNFHRVHFRYDSKGFLPGKADVTVFGMK